MNREYGVEVSLLSNYKNISIRKKERERKKRKRGKRYSHILHALRRLFQAVPADEVVVNLSIFNTCIWRLPTSHDLPHGHSKGPLVQNWG
jgi:hypothetical protein